MSMAVARARAKSESVNSTRCNRCETGEKEREGKESFVPLCEFRRHEDTEIAYVNAIGRSAVWVQRRARGLKFHEEIKTLSARRVDEQASTGELVADTASLDLEAATVVVTVGADRHDVGRRAPEVRTHPDGEERGV